MSRPTRVARIRWSGNRTRNSIIVATNTAAPEIRALPNPSPPADYLGDGGGGREQSDPPEVGLADHRRWALSDRLPGEPQAGVETIAEGGPAAICRLCGGAAAWSCWSNGPCKAIIPPPFPAGIITTMERKRVDIETAGGVARVTMSRPEKHNGLDYRMFEGLVAAIDRCEADRSIHAVVLAGEGPSFCAGLDFASFIAEGRPVEEMLTRRAGDPANFAQRAAAGWGLMPQPVIAAVSGNCLGGGAQIALGADIRIAGEDLRMSILEIKWGLIPDMGISRVLPRLVGTDVAKLLTWTGRTLSANEALDYGLVTEVAADPLARAQELAGEIASKSPDAIRRGKRLYDETWTADQGTALALEEELQRELLSTPNQIESVRAAMAGEVGSFED